MAMCQMWIFMNEHRIPEYAPVDDEHPEDDWMPEYAPMYEELSEHN